MMNFPVTLLASALTVHSGVTIRPVDYRQDTTALRGPSRQDVQGASLSARPVSCPLVGGPKVPPAVRDDPTAA